ncbi:MAG: nitrous oxide reductase family maturation protein NosD [Caldilineales bacterium]|nr:nitrous oxide reductase family maturation protein NosD [Caldilineales bacterium]
MPVAIVAAIRASIQFIMLALQVARRFLVNRKMLVAIIGVLLLVSSIWTMAAAAQDSAFDLNAALATAQPGDAIIVPPGVYPGPLTITRPVTLQGDGMPVIEGTGKGDVITVEAPDVTLRGFVIRNSGDSLDRENAGVTGLAANLTVEDNRFEDVLFGIYLKNAPNSVIRNNEIRSKDLEVQRRGDGIRLWYSSDGVVEGNHVDAARDVIMWFSPNGIVRDNIVENGRYGLHFMFSDNQIVERNILRNNSVGAFLMYGRGLTLRQNLLTGNHGPSGYGVGLKDVDNIVADGNRIIGNRIGLYVDNSPREPSATVLFDNNLIAYNQVGLELQPLTERNTYTNNIFQENGEQVALTTGGQLKNNNWNRDGQGNYWSDYAGFDADGDRIGDLPYKSQSLYENLMESYPELRLFQLSPASDALDMAAKAFPVFQPKPKMADDHPLMTPPDLPAIPGLVPPPTAANLVIAVAMLALALVILLAGNAMRKT